jgi:hypothetical protein
MKMTLDQWDAEIGPHLKGIDYACAKLEYHSNRLAFRPNFEAACEEQMDRAEECLLAALARLRITRTQYEEKARVS